MKYDATPVIGYGEGTVKSGRADSAVRRENNNDWITIGRFIFNVHPYRPDFGGYPVRWIETYDVEASSTRRYYSTPDQAVAELNGG